MDHEIILPGSGITILPAVLRDLKAVYKLERVCFNEDAWPLLDVLGVLTIPQVIRLKAVDDDQLIGFIAADLRRSEATAWIATLAVHPTYRRKGIGAALLKYCESQINLPRIRLCVRESNQSAIQLYQKFNYQQVEVWKKYYRGGENALVFQKESGAVMKTPLQDFDSRV
jgi:ribosomal-protein-alanine N-acetyltransferase